MDKLHDHPGVGPPVFSCVSVAAFDNTHNLLLTSLTASSQRLFVAGYNSAKVLWHPAFQLVYMRSHLSVILQTAMSLLIHPSRLVW